MAKRMRFIRWHPASFLAGILLLLQISPALSVPSPVATERLAVNPSRRLVLPTEANFKALQELAPRYGCDARYDDKRLLDRSRVTNYEFASTLFYCSERIIEIVDYVANFKLPKEDLLTLQQLRQTYAPELSVIWKQEQGNILSLCRILPHSYEGWLLITDDEILSMSRCRRFTGSIQLPDRLLTLPPGQQPTLNSPSARGVKR